MKVESNFCLNMRLLEEMTLISTIVYKWGILEDVISTIFVWEIK